MVTSDQINDTVNNIVNQVLDLLPEGFKHLNNEIQQNFRLALKSVLNNMNLVSREEFDVQVAGLRRAREKLAELEALLDKIAAESKKT